MSIFVPAKQNLQGSLHLLTSKNNNKDITATVFKTVAEFLKQNCRSLEENYHTKCSTLPTHKPITFYTCPHINPFLLHFCPKIQFQVPTISFSDFLRFSLLQKDGFPERKIYNGTDIRERKERDEDFYQCKNCWHISGKKGIWVLGPCRDWERYLTQFPSSRYFYLPW